MAVERKILLLNSDYRPLRFVTWQRGLKLMHREKVDIISQWEGVNVRSCTRAITLPSTLRLKAHVKYYRGKVKFSKKIIKIRDNFRCQYCGKRGERSKLTIDHIIPVSRGGQSTFENCVCACYSCNNKKNNHLLSETSMTLLMPPRTPSYDIYYGLFPSSIHHPDWRIFLK